MGNTATHLALGINPRASITLAGTAIGSYFGSPGIGTAIGATVANLALPEDPETSQGPRLDDLHVQISAYGAPIPIVWGTMRLAGNIIWAAPLTEIQTDTQEGGKGGVVMNEYRYFGTFAISICTGPIDQVLRIWADTKLIYDVHGTQEEEDAPEGKQPRYRIRRSNALQNIHIYKGTETQEPDIWIESYEGAGNVPGHRGLCYVVFKDFALADFGNRIPNFNFEISGNATEIIPYDELSNIQGVSASNNIVYAPDNIHAVIEVNGSWRRINTISNEIVAEAEFSDIPDASDFDIDAAGNIYTSQEHPTSGKSRVVILSPWLQHIAPSSGLVDTPWRIRVGRTRSCPWVVVIPNGGASLEITVKDDFHFDNSQYWVSIAPPTAYVEFVSVDIDETANIIWAVLKDWTDAASYTIIMKIIMNRSGSYTTSYWVKTPDIERGNYILYDKDTDQVCVASLSGDKIVFYDAGDANLAKLGALTGDCTDQYMKSAWQRGTFDGYLYFASGDSTNMISRINIATHELTSWELPADSALGSWDGGSCYDPVTHAVLAAVNGDGFDYIKVYLERCGGMALPATTIVEDICDKAGLDPDTDLVTTDLDTIMVYGYCINQRMTARSAIQPLMDAFFFDGIESAGLLQFIARGGASVVSINDSDLAAHMADSDKPQKLITARLQEAELPRVVEMSYIDYNADYAIGVQRASRQVTQAQQITSLRTAIALDHDTAHQICVKLLTGMWMERVRHTFTISRKYAYLDPGDIITVTEDSNIHTLRILQTNYQGGVIDIQAVSDSASVYSSNTSGVPLPGGDQNVDWPGPTTLALIDCPLLSSSNNIPGIYVATLGMTATWHGAIIYKSNDDGVTWQQWTLSSRDAIIGSAASILADVPDPWLWDNGNTVRVRLLDASDTLESDTAAHVLAGANHGLLGDEIIAWTTVTAEADGSYTLSGLLRGRNGTDWATSNHAINETFVVLNTATIHFLPFPIEEQGLARDYVAVSIGMGWGTGLRQELTCYIRNMMPLAPVHIKGALDSSNNLTLTWIRRVRYGGEWLDNGGPPLGETTELYEVDILDDDSNVIRTLSTGEPLVIYTAAQQTADSITPGDQVTVIVYQVSSSIGRGFGTLAVVNKVRIEVDLAETIATADGLSTGIVYAIEDQDIP